MMLPSLFMALSGAVCGFLEAKEDADTIAAHKPINYAQSNSERLGLLTVSYCVIAGAVMLVTWRLPLVGSLCWIAAWLSAFTIVFRLRLNLLRGFDWRYISPSNRYDWFFLWLGSIPGRGLYWRTLFDPKARCEMGKQWGTIGYHAGWPPYVKWAHRGGALAYGFEAAILVASILIP